MVQFFFFGRFPVPQLLMLLFMMCLWWRQGLAQTVLQWRLSHPNAEWAAVIRWFGGLAENFSRGTANGFKIRDGFWLRKAQLNIFTLVWPETHQFPPYKKIQRWTMKKEPPLVDLWPSLIPLGVSPLVEPTIPSWDGIYLVWFFPLSKFMHPETSDISKIPDIAIWSQIQKRKHPSLKSLL